MGHRARTKILPAILLSGALFLAIWCGSARGDGGTVRLSQRIGGYEVVVFTSPTPLRAGPVDVSVLVQDPETGESVSGVQVAVRVTPRGRPGEAIRTPATTEAATNKLFRAALLELPGAGEYEVEVTIVGRAGDAHVRFAMEAAEPLPRWLALWPWIGWPALAVALFGVHQWLVGRKSRRPRGAPAG